MHASGLFLDQLVFSCKFSRLIDRTTILCTHLNSVRGKKTDRAPGAHLLGQLLVPRVDSLDACLQVPKTEMSRASWTYLLVMDFFFGGPNPHDNQIFCQAHGHAEPELSSTNKRLVRGEACRRQHFVRFPANHPLTAEAAAGHHMFGSAVFVIEYNIS
jgi:hypothetical protein